MYLRIVCAVCSCSTGGPRFCFDFTRNASRLYCILDVAKHTIGFLILYDTFNEIYCRYISFRPYATCFGDKHYGGFFLFPIKNVFNYRLQSLVTATRSWYSRLSLHTDVGSASKKLVVCKKHGVRGKSPAENYGKTIFFQWDTEISLYKTKNNIFTLGRNSSGKGILKHDSGAACRCAPCVNRKRLHEYVIVT